MAIPKITLQVWDRKEDPEDGVQFGPIVAGHHYCLFISIRGIGDVAIPFDTLVEFPDALRAAASNIYELIWRNP